MWDGGRVGVWFDGKSRTMDRSEVRGYLVRGYPAPHHTRQRRRGTRVAMCADTGAASCGPVLCLGRQISPAEFLCECTQYRSRWDDAEDVLHRCTEISISL